MSLIWTSSSRTETGESANRSGKATSPFMRSFRLSLARLHCSLKEFRATEGAKRRAHLLFLILAHSSEAWMLVAIRTFVPLRLLYPFGCAPRGSNTPCLVPGRSVSASLVAACYFRVRSRDIRLAHFDDWISPASGGIAVFQTQKDWTGFQLILASSLQPRPMTTGKYELVLLTSVKGGVEWMRRILQIST